MNRTLTLQQKFKTNERSEEKLLGVVVYKGYVNLISIDSSPPTPVGFCTFSEVKPPFHERSYAVVCTSQSSPPPGYSILMVISLFLNSEKANTQPINLKLIQFCVKLKGYLRILQS